MLGENKAFLRKEEKPREINEMVCLEQGISALNFGRIMEAAQYFFLLEESKNSAVFFNLALCFFKVENYQESYIYLQKALFELPRNSTCTTLGVNLLDMKKYEEENESYKEPMLYLTPIQFPNLAREQILRLVVDILFLLNKKDEMLKAISSLQNKNYKNIKEKLEKELKA
ncbi:tetratricopeptide repeat protein [Fusobacterium russii]|uniref:tetratricopeptide repeat protein n=1 Tax=Fusobacterium russii TaxID=854 RepID=UPI0003A634A7|nr:tetratricopeptide repeat protein [Fusobacterium russii]